VQVNWVVHWGNAHNELGEKLRTALFVVAIIAFKHTSMT
jgi:hypothetical protein